MNEWEHIAMIWQQLENLFTVILALIVLVAVFCVPNRPARRRGKRVESFYQAGNRGRRPWDWI